MSSVHHASVFLYEEYKAQAHWLVGQVDEQHYEPLRERTCEAIRRLQREWPLSNLGEFNYEDGIEKEVLTQTWPLYEHGDHSLATEDEIRSKSIPSPRDLGYWFLIVLAEYLRPCPSPLGNWSVLSAVLTHLGWEQRDRDLLFKGLPTWQLLKPNTMEKSVEPLTNSSPYWLWLKPDWAKSGWLPAEEIDRLYNQLRKLENKVKAFDVRKLPHIDIGNPVVVRDYEEYLQSAYRDTLAMLSAAKELNNQGLFMSITVYA